MKHLILFFFISIISLPSNAQLIKEIRYLGKHKIMFEDETLSTPRKIRPVIQAKNNKQLNKVFRNYKRKRSLNQFLSAFGYLFGPATVVNEFTSPFGVNSDPNYGLISFIAVTAGGAALSNKPAHRALRKLVDEYNHVVLIENIALERELSLNKN